MTNRGYCVNTGDFVPSDGELHSGNIHSRNDQLEYSFETSQDDDTGLWDDPVVAR